MHLRSCEHPIRVYNKYIQDYVWTGCGKCPSCKRRRAAKWISRLEAERRQHVVSMFVTLTYNQDSLPILEFSDDMLRSKAFYSTDGRLLRDDLICIPFDEIKENLSSADAELLNSMMALRGIPYASVSDVQKFHKRLNKYIHDEISYHYKNFRYFTVSEFGSTTLRPHFHCIYFLDSWEVANRFKEAVNACWKYGIVDVQFIESSATSYVANYLNELFSLPSFYEHRQLRPFFLCSKRPSIGSFNEFSTSDEEIFNECLTQVPSPSSGSTKVDFVPLLPSTENRLFPKLPFYRSLPRYAKSQLYRLAVQPRKWLGWSSFKNWLECLKDCFCVSRPDHHPYYVCREYLSLLADNFSEKGVNRLKRAYYISKRVMYQAYLFGVSVKEYVDRIDEYWCKKELMVLSKFFKFQEDYSVNHSSDELAFAYPEYMYQNKFSDEADNYCVSLSECDDLRLQREESKAWHELNTKTHFKNAYFKSLEDKKDSIYKPLLKYYYAKKCNEVIEALT